MNKDLSGNNNKPVGKGRPPVSTRFRPGQSGNPKGRPKGTKNMISLARQALNKKIDIKESGRTKRITVLEAIVMTTIHRALKGDPKILPIIIGFDREISAAGEREILRASRKTPTTASEALEAYRRTLQGED
jgi:hypothetical protein